MVAHEQTVKVKTVHHREVAIVRSEAYGGYLLGELIQAADALRDSGAPMTARFELEPRAVIGMALVARWTEGNE